MILLQDEPTVTALQSSNADDRRSGTARSGEPLLLVTPAALTSRRQRWTRGPPATGCCMCSLRMRVEGELILEAVRELVLLAGISTDATSHPDRAPRFRPFCAPNLKLPPLDRLLVSSHLPFPFQRSYRRKAFANYQLCHS